MFTLNCCSFQQQGLLQLVGSYVIYLKQTQIIIINIGPSLTDPHIITLQSAMEAVL